MSFDFNEVYVMQLAHGDTVPQIVIGVQGYKDRSGDAIKFWRTSGQYPFRNIHGTVVSDESDRIEFLANKKVMFDFEPLTLERWHELGKAGQLVHYKQIKDDFKSDHELKKFYLDEFWPPGYILDVQHADPESD
jgi:hypothetical protein